VAETSKKGKQTNTQIKVYSCSYTKRLEMKIQSQPSPSKTPYVLVM